MTTEKHTTAGAAFELGTPSPYSVFGKWQKRAIVGLVALAAWFSTLSSFIYYPAISLVASDLKLSITKINISVTTYMAVSAVAPAITGDASDIYGRRPLYIFTLCLYVLANIGLACQSTFVGLLLLRMLQSAGISGTQKTPRKSANGGVDVLQVHSRLRTESSPIFPCRLKGDRMSLP